MVNNNIWLAALLINNQMSEADGEKLLQIIDFDLRKLWQC